MSMMMGFRDGLAKCLAEIGWGGGQAAKVYCPTVIFEKCPVSRTPKCYCV